MLNYIGRWDDHDLHLWSERYEEEEIKSQTLDIPTNTYNWRDSLDKAMIMERKELDDAYYKRGLAYEELGKQDLATVYFDKPKK